MQRCCSVFGNAVEIASLIPVNPSEQRMRMSWTPRFFRLFNTDNQYLLLSFSPTTILKTSFMPSSLIPRTTYAASFLITPSSRTEKCTASMKTIGYTADKGRFCHSSILGRSLSVISDTIPSLTSKP